MRRRVSGSSTAGRSEPGTDAALNHPHCLDTEEVALAGRAGSREGRASCLHGWGSHGWRLSTVRQEDAHQPWQRTTNSEARPRISARVTRIAAGLRPARRRLRPRDRTAALTYLLAHYTSDKRTGAKPVSNSTSYPGCLRAPPEPLVHWNDVREAVAVGGKYEYGHFYGTPVLVVYYTD